MEAVKKNKSVTVRAAVIGGVLALISGVIIALINGVFSVASSPPTPSSCPRKVSIKTPDAGDRVDGGNGTVINGPVCGLSAGETVWVFEHDSFDKNYYLVYDPNVGVRPATSGNGQFAMPSGPIGDSGDKDKQYSIIAVVASSECGDSIVHRDADEDGNYVFESLPPGCENVDQVQILVTHR